MINFVGIGGIRINGLMGIDALVTASAGWLPDICLNFVIIELFNCTGWADKKLRNIQIYDGMLRLYRPILY